MIGRPLVDRERPVEYEVDESQLVRVARPPDPTGVFLNDVGNLAATKCDVCSAAHLAETGVMPSSVEPEKLHSQCRTPGSCICECEYARGARCVNCGRARPAGLLEQGTEEGGASCVDRAECAKAMLDAGPAPKPEKVAKAPTSGDGRSSRPASAPKPPRAPAQPKVSGPKPACRCGCGETTGGGTYRPGHDARHVKNLIALVRSADDDLTLAEALTMLPSEALRDKLSKQVGGSG